MNFVSQILGRYDTAIWIRVIGTILTTFASFMIRPFLALYLFDKLQGNLLLTAVIVGLQPLTGLIAGVYSGNLADRYGRKPMMVAALVIQAGTMIGYIFAESVLQFALITIINGLGQSMFWPAASAQITDLVPEEKRSEVFALMHTALNVGAALGPLIGVMIYKINPGIAFGFCALAELIYLGLLIWKVPETLPKAMRVQKDGTAERVAQPEFKIRKHMILIWLTMAMIPCAMLYSQVEIILPQHLKTNFDSYVETFATLLAINGAMVVLLQIVIAKFADRFAVRNVIFIAFLFLACTAFGYGFAKTFWLLVIAEISFTIGEMLNGPQIQKAVSIMAPPELRGRYFAIFGAHYGVTGTIAPTIGALTFQKYGGEAWFSIIGVLLIVAAFAHYRLLGRALGKPTKEAKQAPAQATS
ncbi:MFS transporter [Tumebacillus algifaecis]|uniref:MFS transporter n=1 Tax=Tumebacillus algifaecis TaxID=1214604 RepID=A0A223CZK1_9BACL|nr:MFS transporter [Tumebacillus algifaecis]ASS74614.1 MFS transporter [Tumebacillus algifaecis]